jgi:hypothetical protein
MAGTDERTLRAAPQTSSWIARLAIISDFRNGRRLRGRPDLPRRPVPHGCSPLVFLAHWYPRLDPL